MSESKRPRLDVNPDPEGCAEYVERKKRWCRLSVAKGNRFCGEHSKERGILSESPGVESSPRIPCPLDPKHTIFADRLNKHLKICNARKHAGPEFIKENINAGSEDEDEATDPANQPAKLSDDATYLQALVDKVRGFYDSIKTSFDPREEVFYHSHPALQEELSNTSYGPDTLKHLRQTSALIGSLHRLELLQQKTCFIEFGAGKGQVSYFLSNSLEDAPESAVVLVDRATMRHKMDNKCQDRSAVHRVRADIADLDLKAVPQVQGKEKIVGISKHLCGAATDLAIRCMVQSQAKSQAMVIAVCCHHRCTWKAFVGKSEFRKRNISSRDFLYIIKMVSWAVCGGGMSRERRKLIEEQGGVQTGTETNPVKTSCWSREEQEEIGYMCKRIIDYSRLKYLQDQGYATGAFYYISKDVTLENLCIFAKSKCTNSNS